MKRGRKLGETQWRSVEADKAWSQRIVVEKQNELGSPKYIVKRAHSILEYYSDNEHQKTDSRSNSNVHGTRSSAEMLGQRSHVPDRSRSMVATTTTILSSKILSPASAGIQNALRVSQT